MLHDGQLLRPTAELRFWAWGRRVLTTAEHPLWVWGRGWVPAGSLRPGDLLRSAHGPDPVVLALTDAQEETVVYNLRVAWSHTYFVGGLDWPCSVWAHNAYHTRSGTRRVRAQARKASQPHQLSLFPELEKGNATTGGATRVGAAINREPVSTTETGGAQETDRASGGTGDTAPAAIPGRTPNPNAPRPVIKTRLPDRVTKELPEGEIRTPKEEKQARNFLNAIGKQRGDGGKNEKEETGQKMPHMMSIQDPSRTEVILYLLSRALMGRHGGIWRQVISAVGGKWGGGLVSNYLPHNGKVKSRTEKMGREVKLCLITGIDLRSEGYNRLIGWHNVHS